MKKNSKIFVAGHNGLVGSAVLRQLKKQGYSNIIVKSHSELDLCDNNKVDEFFKTNNIEYVFLCAAKVGGIVANSKNKVEFLSQNIYIEFNVINACLKYNIKKLMFFGSSCIYPKNCMQPIKEEYLLSGELESTNEGYALAKISGLKYIEYINKEYNKKYVSVMPTNLYGINDNYNPESSHVIPGIIDKIYNAKKLNNEFVELYGTGTPLREFMNSDDLAKVCINIMNKDESNGIYNIGTGDEISIKELAYLIKNIIDYKGRIIFNSQYPDGVKRKIVDISKIKNEKFNLKTNITLEEGLKKAYKDYLKRL